MSWGNHTRIKDDEEGGEGLEGIEEDLRQLNEAKRVDYPMNIKNKKNKYKVKLSYKSDLLIIDDYDHNLIKDYFNKNLK